MLAHSTCCRWYGFPHAYQVQIRGNDPLFLVRRYIRLRYKAHFRLIPDFVKYYGHKSCAARSPLISLSFKTQPCYLDHRLKLTFSRTLVPAARPPLPSSISQFTYASSLLIHSIYVSANLIGPDHERVIFYTSLDPFLVPVRRYFCLMRQNLILFSS